MSNLSLFGAWLAVKSREYCVTNQTWSVSDDFGTVKVYQYPCNQATATSFDLYGHSAHVMGVALLNSERGLTLVSAGGREGSIIQRTALNN